MSIYLEIFLAFLKIGTVSFGGGYGMIPIIRDEMLSRGWITDDVLWNYIAIAESTPGPIAINIATFVGNDLAGFWGSLLATTAVVIPAFAIILIIAAIFKNFASNKYVKAAMKGVTPIIWGLIISTGLLLVVKCFYAEYNDFDAAGEFNFHALIIFAVVGGIALGYRLIRKKKIPPIALILISAAAGMIYYIPL